MDKVIELCRVREIRNPGQAGRLMFPTYHSKFLRDMHNCPQLTSFLSQHFKTPIGPHPMPQMHQINYSHDEAGKVIVPWHHDQIGFTMVLSMYDPDAVKGGRFEWFWGTREEGQKMLDEQAVGSMGELPANRTTSPKCKPGVACFMQGSAIMHRGAPMEEPGYRASVVFSYVTRDTSFPDANRSYFTKGWERGMGVGLDQVQPKATEWARHKAWFARARLGTLIEELPFSEDRAAIAKQLRMAIAPVITAIERLEAEPEDFQFGRGRRPEQYYKDDEIQNTEERFLPGLIPIKVDA
jgi:hypothetical protein